MRGETFRGKAFKVFPGLLPQQAKASGAQEDPGGHEGQGVGIGPDSGA